MNRALVELTVRYGHMGYHHKTVAIPIPGDLTSELLEAVEYDPSTLVFGCDRAATIKRKTFEMRRSVAEEIAKAMVPALLEAFGVNDTLGGYKIDQMPKSEIEYHKSKGQL